MGEAGGMNLYGYVGNNPINLVDPLGLSWLGDFINLINGVTGNPNTIGSSDGTEALLLINFASA
jgi:hypothetical protein